VRIASLGPSSARSSHSYARLTYEDSRWDLSRRKPSLESRQRHDPSGIIFRTRKTDHIPEGSLRIARHLFPKLTAVAHTFDALPNGFEWSDIARSRTLQASAASAGEFAVHIPDGELRLSTWAERGADWIRLECPRPSTLEDEPSETGDNHCPHDRPSCHICEVHNHNSILILPIGAGALGKKVRRLCVIAMVTTSISRSSPMAIHRFAQDSPNPSPHQMLLAKAAAPISASASESEATAAKLQSKHRLGQIIWFALSASPPSGPPAIIEFHRSRHVDPFAGRIFIARDDRQAAGIMPCTIGSQSRQLRADLTEKHPRQHRQTQWSDSRHKALSPLHTILRLHKAHCGLFAPDPVLGRPSNCDCDRTAPANRLVGLVHKL